MSVFDIFKKLDEQKAAEDEAAAQSPAEEVVYSTEAQSEEQE